MTVPTVTRIQPAIRQYSRGTVLAIWATASAPMALGAWVLAPRLAGSTSGGRFAESLIAIFTAGLVWQFVLVVAVVAHEQGSLRWRVVREALWLDAPSTPSGRRGGRLWWWALALVAAFGVVEFAPISPPAPPSRDFGAFLGSAAGQATLRGNWGLFALVVVLCVFNTVLGEELLFRGLLLPRMRAAFGRADWLVNGVIFGLYHLHQPWSIPSAIVGGAMSAYATRRLRSAWMGILAHSAQSVLFITLTLAVVAS
jgi:uncharacterized protein